MLCSESKRVDLYFITFKLNKKKRYYICMTPNTYLSVHTRYKIVIKHVNNCMPYYNFINVIFFDNLFEMYS